MVKYIARETDRALSRKLTYAYAIGILALCIIGNIAVVAFRTIYGTNEGTYAYNIIEYATWSFIIPYLSSIIIADIVFGAEYPNPHIKDGVTSNLNRTQIYLSKLISAIIVGVVFLVATFVTLIVTTTIFQHRDGNISAVAITGFCDKLALALPLFLAGIAFGMMFLFCFENKKKAYAGFYVLTLVIPRLIIFLATDPASLGICKALKPYTISQCFTLIPYPSNPDRKPMLIIGLGIGYAIIATVIGAIAYNKKDMTNKE